MATGSIKVDVLGTEKITFVSLLIALIGEKYCFQVKS